MKILITADLHYREHWFRWLSAQAGDFDLICMAGDLLDMFCGEPRIAQAREVSRWIRDLAKLSRVAICSGNHDDAGRQISADRAPVYEWLFALGKERNIITDGVTQTVNDLIVTTVPYHCSKQQKSVWLDRGSTFLDAPFPNHIILDTNSGQARWETSSKEWIPEDLFTKFPPA